MISINAIGNITKDIEVKYVERNNEKVAVANFSIAVRDGRKEDTFYDVTAWGDLALIIGENTTKGSKIAIIGKPKLSKYVQDGVTQKSFSIIINEVEFLSPRPKPIQQDLFHM